MSLTQEQQDEIICSFTLKGRDLMYYILNLYERSIIDGDNLTAFLADNINDATAINYLQEEVHE